MSKQLPSLLIQLEGRAGQNLGLDCLTSYAAIFFPNCFLNYEKKNNFFMFTHIYAIFSALHFFHRSTFPPGIISLQRKELPLTFLICAGLLTTNSPRFHILKCLQLSLLKNNFVKHKNSS